MVSDWEKVLLGEHCVKIGSGATPRGGSSVYLEKGDISLIRSQNIYNDGFQKGGLVYITEEAAEKLRNVAIEDKDILLNITGDSVARVCLVDNGFLPARVNQHVAIIRPFESSFDSVYLRYQLVSPTMQRLLLNLASAGATRNALTKNMIETLVITKPDLRTQKAIAHILGSLDDKIELNRQMNETLEAMAQALFKSWFVDFDPVIDNALAAGNPIPDELLARAEQQRTMLESDSDNQAIRALFPDEFEFTEEMGWIPKGWMVKKAEEVASIAIGKTPPRKEPQWFSDIRENNLVWVSIRDMGNSNVFIDDSSEYLTKESVAKFNVRTVPKDAVILSFKFTVGRVLITQTELTTNEAIAHFSNPRFGMSKEYIYSYLNNFNYDSLGSTSSIATAVNSKIIKAMPFIVPSELILNKFENTSKMYFDKISIINQQTQTLSKLRDTLLPKLLSGELRIPDAAAMVEDA